ncbi:MAG: TIM barrel protein [Candidatus Diapherotrites archaeon]
MEMLIFGTAGVPHSSASGDSVAGIERVRKLGLDAMELEFVRGVHMKEDTAKKVKAAAEKNNVLLRVHAPYFINLNSAEKSKLHASIERIWQSAKIGDAAGARIVTFHPAYFQGTEPKKVMENVETALDGLLERIKEKKLKIVLAPETTGKPSQFGSLSETLELCKRMKGKIMTMVDFSHLHARENGRFKEKKDFEKALEEIKSANRAHLKELHMHVSGIRFSEKGERNHLNLQDKENTFNYKWLLETLKEFGVKGVVICESPNLEGDALLMQKYYEKL